MIEITSGQVSYPKMTNKLEAAEYAAIKLHVWLYMLQDGMVPKKWLRPNGAGTRVNFVPLVTKEDANAAMDELKGYLDEINQMYGFEFELTPNEQEAVSSE